MLAVMLSTNHLLRAAMSVSSGWLARAERLLGNEAEIVEHGHLALARGMNALAIGELDTASSEIGRAHELGARFGDRSLEAMALVLKGTVLVSTGEVMEGLALLDEATAAAVSGELHPLATGVVYCVTIDSCQMLGDCGRAAEWTRPTVGASASTSPASPAPAASTRPRSFACGASGRRRRSRRSRRVRSSTTTTAG